MESLINKLFIDAKRNKDLKAMKSLLNGNPNNPLIKFEYAKLLIENNQIEEGKALYIELLDSRNSDFAMFELGKLCIEENNYKEARKYLEPIANKGDFYSILLLGKMDLNEGKIQEARKTFKYLADNNDIAGKLELGRIELKLGNVEKAKSLFVSVVERNHDLKGMVELGRLYETLKDYDQARQIFESLLKTNKKYTAIIELGKLEYSSGNTYKAKEYLLSLLDSPVEKYSYRLLTIMEIKQSNYIEAFMLIKEAIEKGYDINPDILIFISKKLNVLLNIDYQSYKYSYTMGQEVEYDDFLAMDHITERHIKQNRDFKDDIDVFQLFNDLKNDLNKEYKISKLNFNDIYVIPYKGIGSYGRNYLKVITLPNSNEIITMYPVYSKYENIDEDIDKMDEEIEKMDVNLTNKGKML